MPEDGKPWWERRSDNWISGNARSRIEAQYHGDVRVALELYQDTVREARQKRARAIARLEGWE